MTTEEKFFAAVDVINSLPLNGPFQPSDDLMLKFYAYYKQATVGPCCSPKPSFWEVIARNRWNAWKDLGMLPKKIAMEKYVEELSKVIETMSYNETVSKFISTMSPFYEAVCSEDDSHEPDLSKGDMKEEKVEKKFSEFNPHSTPGTFQAEQNVFHHPPQLNERAKFMQSTFCSESFKFGMGMSDNHRKSSSENSSTVTFEERSSSPVSSESESQSATLKLEEIIEMFKKRTILRNLPISTTKDLLILTILNVQHSLEDIEKHLEKLESIVVSTSELEKQQAECENFENKSWSLKLPGTALVLLWPLAVHWCMHIIRSSSGNS